MHRLRDPFTSHRGRQCGGTVWSRPPAGAPRSGVLHGIKRHLHSERYARISVCEDAACLGVVPLHARLDAEAIPGRLLPPMRGSRGRTDTLQYPASGHSVARGWDSVPNSNSTFVSSWSRNPLSCTAAVAAVARKPDVKIWQGKTRIFCGGRKSLSPA